MANFIWDSNGTNMARPSDDIFENGFALVEPDWVETSPNYNWILNAITTNAVRTGDIDFFAGSTIPDGFLLCNGNGISQTNKYTSATFYGDEYKDLFFHLWEYYPQSHVIPSGRGASALADWENDFVLTLPNIQGFTLAYPSDVTGSVYNQPAGSVVGTYAVSLAPSNLPELQFEIVEQAHSHQMNNQIWEVDPTTIQCPNNGILGGLIGLETLVTESATTGVTIQPLGNAVPALTSTASSSVIVNIIIKI
jgi:microcystin-dependent protein